MCTKSVRRGQPVLFRNGRRGLELCRTWRFVVGTPVLAATLGAAYALGGRAHEALPLVADAVEEFRIRQVHNRPALVLLCAGMACLRCGGSTRPPATPERPWRSPAGWGRGGARPTPLPYR